eukprot:TRINITY_DN1259_c0_g1_i1.p2 TRINITY_DN1259_c0_g1~~TRINITY_DN1259_c0_g1_i1.p2  ORF type:complete len:246 (+),score=50.63 TRINITY_DN1259_c0_g1_i1:3922-4659(+)
MEKAPPRRPLTPFFMFREKEKEKGNSMAGVEAGEQWRSMSDSQKKPYVDAYKKAREKYDRYLEEQGMPPRTSSKKKEKPTKFRTTRVRTICGKSKEPKGADQKVYKGLAKVAEAFIMDLGKTIGEELKAEERRTVTVDMMARALEKPKFGFLSTMEEFDTILREAEEAAHHEHVKRSKARKKKDTDEEEEEEKPKRARSSKRKASKKSTKRRSKEDEEQPLFYPLFLFTLSIECLELWLSQTMAY